MKNLRLSSTLFLAACIHIAGCELIGLRSGDPERTTPRVLTSQEAQVTRSGNQFGFELLQALSEEVPEDNLFLSPLSISMALGMTLNGARGETRAAMEETLALAGLSQEEINASYRSLIDLLSGLDPKVIFEIANSIWARQGYPVEPTFLQINRDYFDAEVRELDFSDPASLEVINGWVDDKTRGKIEEILDRIDPATVMFLINAIYFKGTWTYEFSEDETRDEPFLQRDGTTVRVPMMRQQADLPYFETEAFQAVDLPYGDSLFSMTVLLPHEGHDLDELISGVDPEVWDTWMTGLSSREVDLRLPRFELEYEKTLNDILTALGMGIAFDAGRADFSGINGSGGLWIDFVKHKAFVEVNEEGTEAAAATVVAILECAGCGEAPVSVHVNRPFAFLIRERTSGTILFVGKVNAL